MVAWILFMIIVLLAIVFVAVAMWRKKERRIQPDYFSWFVIGLVWIVTGIILVILEGPEQSSFLVMGTAFALAGILHKSKWKENRHQWKHRNELIIALSMIVLAAMVAAMIVLAVLRE